MSDPPRSSRPSSDRSKNTVSTPGSTRYGSISLHRSAADNGTSTSHPTRSDLSSRSRRRTHSTERPPRDDTNVDDVTARLERREERRRLRAREEVQESHSSQRSSSLSRIPRPSVPEASPRTQPTSPYATTSRRSGTSRSTDASDPGAYADESMDKLTSLASRKAAYLAAAEKKEQPWNGDGVHRCSSLDSTSLRRSRSKSTDEDATLSLDRSPHSSRHRSHREHGSEKSPSKKEKKSRKSHGSTPEGTPERKSRKSSGSTPDSPERLVRSELSRSGSSDGKSRKREKKSSSKDKKRSSKSHEDRVEQERGRSSRDDVFGDSERPKERRHRGRSSDGLSIDRRSARSDDGLSSDRKTSRSKSRQRSGARHDEFSKRRDERPIRDDDVIRGEEYQKRREERIAQREERRSRESSGELESRSRRSSSMPRRSAERSSDIDAASTSSAVSRSRKSSSDHLTKSSLSSTRTSSTTKNILGAMTGSGELGDRKSVSHGSTDAEAARERLRERMAARLEAKNSVASDTAPAASRNIFGARVALGKIGDDKSQQKGEDVSLPVIRPKLVDVNRRGVAGILKQQLQSGIESRSTRTSLPPSPPSSESDTEEESLPEDDQENDDDDSSAGEEDEMWTIRVSIISAVDLPLNLVPNMPLCPVLKFGLITLPVGDDDDGNTDVHDDAGASEGRKSSKQRQSTLARLEKLGLTSIPGARVRCTSNKLLSKRDNGSVSFHEEMRWDRVRQPMRTALVVELFARAALPPPNLKESPMISQAVDADAVSSPLSMKGVASTHIERKSNDLNYGMWSSTAQRADLKRQSEEGAVENDNSMAAATRAPLSASSSVASSDAATPAVHGAGLTGMRALWRKGREQFEQRQMAKPSADEVSGQMSSSVAGESNAEDAQSLGRGFSTTQPSKHNMVASLEDENVALLRPKKKRKLEMAEDLRLGSLVIPLTRLPLETAIQNKEAVRIEQWYQLDANDVLVPTAPTWRGKSATKPLPRRSPTVQLEISFSPPEVLDQSEDEMDDISESDLAVFGGDGTEDEPKGNDLSSEQPGKPSLARTKSYSRRTSAGRRTCEKPSVVQNESLSPARPKKKVPEDPVLEPGLVDFVCVVGVNNVGDQKDDDGSKGWVNTSPECTILEQFPPNDEFHNKNGRDVALANKVEWFCFPEGWRLWRGIEPPSREDINIDRLSLSAASASIVSNSLASFDACLGCTTSFCWFVISSSSDEYGSRNVKTYGAVIKFYAPAPKGIDQTQDDYAQTLLGVPIKAQTTTQGSLTAKRLWVPIGICLTSNLPIVGIMEAMLLRICESLASKTGGSLKSVDSQNVQSIIQKDIANLILNFQKPIPGVLHCSIPFLSGERLHITLPPPTGLPPLPHGSSVTALCRLLGADGLNTMLAAVLTECKIVIHSHEVSNLAMVAEVITALMYPFYWALPYIPVLPCAMLEFVEAPLSYFLGIPTSSLKLIDPNVLEDVVVIDLDSGFNSPDYFEGRRAGKSTKAPTPLPASVATKISKAVFRLLREEGEVEDQYSATNYPGSRSLPRVESESLAEREFRIAIALQVCWLVRGYDDCLFKVSASQPVFNRDKFLRTAPALFENQRGSLPLGGPSNIRGVASRTLSPRSKRFLSILVNCQHFHQFLEMLEDDECAFFNEVMYTFDMNDEQEDDRRLGGYGTSSADDATAHLSRTLQKVEDKIPTYRVERQGKKKRRSSGGWDDDDDDIGLINQTNSPEKGRDKGASVNSFPFNLLQPLCMDTKSATTQIRQSTSEDDASVVSEGVHKMSVEYLMELEKRSWRYEKLFDIPVAIEENEEGGETPSLVQIREKVRLREAIGERRYRAWKLAQEQKFAVDDPGTHISSEDMLSVEANPALDLTSLLSSMADDVTSDTSSVSQSTLSISTQNSARPSMLSPEQQRVADAKDRDVLRRCLERAYGGNRQRSGTRPSGEGFSVNSISDSFIENGRDLIAEAETALRNPSAQRFLVSVLSQRSRIESQKKRRNIFEDSKGARRQSVQTSVSRLETSSFECLVRLCCAMLDSCMETKEYEPAYGLLTHTAGFCTVQTKEGGGVESQIDDDTHDPAHKVIYMTARIGLHPIFADLHLWEEVLRLHLKDRESDKSPGVLSSSLIGKVNNSDLVEYEAAVATLYEMLGFGIPAEELARFATQVSEERGWFETERGHSLVMLARRLGVRKEQGDEGVGTAGDLDLMGNSMGFQGVPGIDNEPGVSNVKGGATAEDDRQLEWTEIGWCHPAAPSTVRPQYVQSGANGDEDNITKSRRLKRSPVTSLASFGSSIVASGGLDGSVFLAHTIQFGRDEDGKQSENCVQGVHLDWGSSGSRTAAVASSLTSMDGEYGVGAVSCLAAAKGAGYRSSALSASVNKDVKGKADQEEFLSAMEGCRVVAGTTGGDLRVWSVKDVYASTVLAKKGSEKDSTNWSESRDTHSGSGTTSSLIGKAARRGNITDIAAGSASSRLKFSLRGRALSGHRGGVSCIDVPSHIYRPDALVTGGADGFIKLWSLRQPIAGRREVLPGPNPTMFNTGMGASNAVDPMGQGRTSRSGDALSILSGHTGRVLCVKTAWHGDRLLSGGADRTVRIWDLAGSGGKCLHTLTGHLGWVTHTHYWGQHTVVTASTDRSIALWDPRVRRSPLFILRYHYSPVSDLLVGSRTDPLMASAAGDGTIATWDFRALSGANKSTENPAEGSSSPVKTEGEKRTRAVRTPLATMKHGAEGKGVRQSGSVMLARGVAHRNTVFSVGVDAIVREWDIPSGRPVSQEATGHCDGISGLATFSDAHNALGAAEPGSEGNSNFGGIITSSWDGTIRMRKFVRK